MALVAACTDKGARRKVNEDALCIQAAQTSFGEVVMAVVCDGAGGLSVGELASATVVARFAEWFKHELPQLIDNMPAERPFDFRVIELDWSQLLNKLNNVVRAYGLSRSIMLGTTFTGFLLCNGNFLIAHIGDCRLYRMDAYNVQQLTEDQTLAARKLTHAKISLEAVNRYNQGNDIVQSLGAEDVLNPAFYHGSYTANDLFVLCSVGAYHMAERVGIRTFFNLGDRVSEEALQEACQRVLTYAVEQGEKDNLTILCVCADLENATHATSNKRATHHQNEINVAMNVLPRRLDPLANADEDNLSTTVESVVEADEDDLVTLVEDSEA